MDQKIKLFCVLSELIDFNHDFNHSSFSLFFLRHFPRPGFYSRTVLIIIWFSFYLKPSTILYNINSTVCLSSTLF